jgi:hypothetical protein
MTAAGGAEVGKMTMVQVRAWLGAVLVLAAGCVTRSGPVPRERCENRLIEQVVAPGGGAKAVVFERRCAAPTGFSTQVSVLGPDDRLPDMPGNVFIAGNGGRISRGRSFITVTWPSATKLAIGFESGTAVFKGEPRVGAVEIVYVRRDTNNVHPQVQGDPQSLRER